jgi:hypothetical protein
LICSHYYYFQEFVLRLIALISTDCYLGTAVLLGKVKEERREKNTTTFKMNEIDNKFSDILLQPYVLLFLDFPSIANLALLNRRHSELIKDDNLCLGYWPAICNAYCTFAGLYSPILLNPEKITRQLNYRKHFFDDLWAMRKKWHWTSTSNEKDEQNISGASYKVKVSCRFRPGEPPVGKVCLPLHQFLRVKRQQKQKEAAEAIEKNVPNDDPHKNTLLLGEHDPEEFLDPILGSIMKEPVLLSTSGRIIDRSVAIQCILRGGRDPFNNLKLTMEMLEPQAALASRIRDWKVKKLESKKTDVALDLKELKSLVDDVALNEDFLEALMEVERIRGTLHRAKLSANVDDLHSDSSIPSAQPRNSTPLTMEVESSEAIPFNPETLENEQFLQHILAENSMDMNGEGDMTRDDDDDKKKPTQKAETARLVDINQSNSFVSMHIPGSGVRPFHFANVLGHDVQQEQIYQRTTHDSVTAVLNGNNACVMCYGQTGENFYLTCFIALRLLMHLVVMQVLERHSLFLGLKTVFKMMIYWTAKICNPCQPQWGLHFVQHWNYFKREIFCLRRVFKCRCSYKCWRFMKIR